MNMPKKQTVCNTVGKGIYAIILTYACCVALAGILTLISYIADPSFLGLIITAAAFLIALVSFVLAIVIYKCCAGSVAFDNDNVVIKQPGKQPSTLRASELQSAALDSKGALTITLRDGSTYKLGKMAANVHAFLAFSTKYTDQT